MDNRFAIIDIETTGGSPTRDKITEIGIVFHNGTQVTDTWQSLINPERSIPAHITRITGIDNAMVQNAPRFFEIAKQLVEITEKCIFVAHNVRFDYGFISEEYRQLGFTYALPKLCTVQMSRRAFPGLPSYSLGKLTKHFNIPLKNHHRAMADALATAELFQLIVKSDYYSRLYPIIGRKSIKEQKLPASISLEQLNKIPNTPGVYYFKNKDEQIVYIGKSKHLQKRIYDHFADHSERSARLQSAVYDIDFIITGNELAALLLESYEIKKHNPTFNKAQKRKYFKYALAGEQGGQSSLPVVLPLSKVTDQVIYRYFIHKKDANTALKMACHEVGLCQCVLSDKNKEMCLHYKLQLCHDEYDDISIEDRLGMVHRLMERSFESDGLWVGPGRTAQESFVVAIKHRVFHGMGYFDHEYGYTNFDLICDQIDRYPFNTEVSGILHSYLKNSKDFKWKPAPSGYNHISHCEKKSKELH